MMYEEEQEMQHEISKLREKVQQISISQKVTKNEMDGLKKDVEAKMNDLEAKMDGMEVGMEAKIDNMEAKIDEKMQNMKNDLKVDIKGLTKLIQQMFPNGEKIAEDTHC